MSSLSSTPVIIANRLNSNPAPCFLPPELQGFESVADLSGTLAKIENRVPWDGGEGTVEAADEFDLADLMGDDDKDKKEEL